MKLGAAAGLCLVVVAHAALAQSAPDPHAVQPERPTVATHAGTVAPGWLEIETGVEFDSPGSRWQDFGVPTVFKIGLAPRMQLSLSTPLVRPTDSGGGIGDFSAGVKWRLLEDAPVLGNFAILPTMKFATGDAMHSTGTGTTDVSLLLISSHDFGDVSMDINVGYTRRGGDGTAAPRDATLWTASFGGPVQGRLGWTAECFGYPGTSGAAGAPPSVALLGGPTFLAHPWIALDAGVIRTFVGTASTALYAGVTYNIGKL